MDNFLFSPEFNPTSTFLDAPLAGLKSPSLDPHICRKTNKQKTTHAHMHTLFLLSSARLLPITEVCREGPHDCFTGCREDKQVYVLANICQGWISLKPETKAKKKEQQRKIEKPSWKQTLWKYDALPQQQRRRWWKVRRDVPARCHLFLRSHLLLHNGIIIKRNLVNLPRSPAPRVEINVAQSRVPWTVGAAAAISRTVSP